MTYEEAITIANCWVRSRGAYTDRATWQTNNEAAKLAIEAMEKQIPKKYELRKASAHVIVAVCPTCGEIPQNNYCHNCGQAIDWSDCE